MLIRSCRNSVNPWKAPLDQFDRAWSSFFPEPLRGWSRFSWPIFMGTPDKDHGDPARTTDSRIIWTIAIVIVGGGGFGLLWLFHR